MKLRVAAAFPEGLYFEMFVFTLSRMGLSSLNSKDSLTENNVAAIYIADIKDLFYF